MLFGLGLRVGFRFTEIRQLFGHRRNFWVGFAQVIRSQSQQKVEMLPIVLAQVVGFAIIATRFKAVPVGR